MIAIFLFYNEATGKQTRYAFSDEFKHCNIICYDGDIYLLIELSKHGITYRQVKAKDSYSLLRNLKVIKSLSAMITVNIEQPFTMEWRPLWIKSCNELCRYVSGVDIGLTFNPIHLFKKLLKYNLHRNYEVLNAWRRKKWESLVETKAETILPTC